MSELQDTNSRTHKHRDGCEAGLDGKTILNLELAHYCECARLLLSTKATEVAATGNPWCIKDGHSFRHGECERCHTPQYPPDPITLRRKHVAMLRAVRDLQYLKDNYQDVSDALDDIAAELEAAPYA